MTQNIDIFDQTPNGKLSGPNNCCGHPLDPLVAPRSIALIGASTNLNSFGNAMLHMAMGGSFEGNIYPVNPKYAEINGFNCYDDLSELPERAQHVVLGVANERVEQCLLDAIHHGAKAVTIFADGHGGQLESRLRSIAAEANILICGPNSMGFHNLDKGLRITPFPAPLNLIPGNIAAILQSGSVLGALAHNDQRLRFNFLVSPGSEINVTASEYLDWAIDQPTTKVVGLFLEAVRKPQDFLNSLQKAERLRIPLVMLKVGRTEISKRLAASHTGALIGNHDVFHAVAEDYGVHIVHTIDELAASLQFFSQGREAAPGGLATIHDSGGERELLADLCSDLNVPLAKLRPTTVEKIQPNLEEGLKAENPLDAWGSGKNAETTFLEAATALMDDEEVGLGFYVLDWRQDYYYHEMHEKILNIAVQKTTKPMAAVSNYSLTNNQQLAMRLADNNIPLIEGTREALLAAKFLMAQAQHQPKVRDIISKKPNPMKMERLCSSDWVGEAQGFDLLSSYGVEVAPHKSADNKMSAIKIAEELGYPVVLKTSTPNIAHKTEVKGIKLNLRNEDEFCSAYDDLSKRLGPNVLICKMMKGQSEWMIGAINDKDFGPAIMISPGGVLVELLDERVVIQAPFTVEVAAKKLEILKSTKLLQGYRGQPPLAFAAFCRATAAISRLAYDFQDIIDEIDVNPVLISESNAVALDVLIKKIRK